MAFDILRKVETGGYASDLLLDQTAGMFDELVKLEPANHTRYYLAAPLRLYLGDDDAYRAIAAEMLERFGRLEAPVAAPVAGG